MLPRLTAILVFLGSMSPAVVLVSPAAAPRFQDRPTFSIQSSLVVLHVLVRDKSGAYVSNLPRDAFAVVEDNRRQTIDFFDKQDAPVTVGLLIDNSGSMQSARNLVIAAATTFAETSNQMDEIFALVFNDNVRAALSAEHPFTGDPETLRAALGGAIRAAGRTALYDAISAGMAYADRGSHERRVLVVVSDGGDNASSATFDSVLRAAQASNTVIDTVALTDPAEPDGNPGRLKALSDASGGESFLPPDITHVEDVLRRIARDIRNTYTVGYVSTNQARDGRFRRVQVTAHATDGRSLVVHTRRGYTVAAR